MTTLVLGSPPPELEALLERRRRAGADRLDEVWQGVRHMVPGPSLEHARVAHQLAVLLVDPAERAVTWLALHHGDYQPVQHSGLIELGPAELAERLDWR